MSEAEELDKAALHRAQAVRRGAYHDALKRRLGGNLPARIALQAQFDPMLKAVREHRDDLANPGGADPC